MKNKKGFFFGLSKEFVIIMIIGMIIWTVFFVDFEGKEQYEEITSCLDSIGEDFCEGKGLIYYNFNVGRNFFVCGDERQDFHTGEQYDFTLEELRSCGL